MTQVRVIRKDDHLEHKAFKYLKKEKVNGKWRYYYDTKGFKNELNDYKKALSSNDELDAFVNAAGVTKNGNKRQWIKEADKRLQSAKTKAEATKKGYMVFNRDDAVNASVSAANDKLIKQLESKKKKYEESKTVKGKIKALKKAFKKNNPKNKKSVKKGEAYVNSILASKKA